MAGHFRYLTEPRLRFLAVWRGCFCLGHAWRAASCSLLRISQERLSVMSVIPRWPGSRPPEMRNASVLLMTAGAAAWRYGKPGLRKRTERTETTQRTLPAGAACRASRTPKPSPFGLLRPLGPFFAGSCNRAMSARQRSFARLTHFESLGRNVVFLIEIVFCINFDAGG